MTETSNNPETPSAAATATARWFPSNVAIYGATVGFFVLMLGVQWLDSRREIDSLRQEVAKRLSDADVQSRESRATAERVRDATNDAQVKIGVLESKLAESQSQQIALEALYQELSRNRDEWAFAEIEQSLLIASQQLQLAGNVKAALIALQNADSRLQRMERPQLLPLRKAINRDMERLKSLPYFDAIGISVRLDGLIASIDQFPLASETRPGPPPVSGTKAAQPADPWMRFLGEAWNDLRDLVRIQRMDRPDVPLLSPSQTFFLRENLKLRLISARLALLTRDQTSYKDDLRASRDWLNRYFDARDRGVNTALGTIRNLHDSPISIEVPDLGATLDALRTVRASRERPGRAGEAK